MWMGRWTRLATPVSLADPRVVGPDYTYKQQQVDHGGVASHRRSRAFRSQE